jgi:hypothetical protein
MSSTYGHLVPDSEPYLRGLLDAFDDAANGAEAGSRRVGQSVSLEKRWLAQALLSGAGLIESRRGRRALTGAALSILDVVINKAWPSARRRHRCATPGHRPGGQACV